MKQQCDLKTCMFCMLCVPEWIPVINNHRKMISLKKGDLLFEEGNIMTSIYFVYSGIVKVHKKWGPKELIIRFGKKGDIIGHRGLGNEILYPVSATALEDGLACFIPLDIFMSSLKINYEFLYRLMLFFAEELKLSEQKMRNLAHMTVRGRVAQSLLLLKNKFGIKPEGYIDILLSRQDLASYAGTTYETVFRVITDLSEQNILKVKGKKISILNETALQLLTINE